MTILCIELNYTWKYFVHLIFPRQNSSHSKYQPLKTLKIFDKYKLNFRKTSYNSAYHCIKT
jgi:hypothetical protein